MIVDPVCPVIHLSRLSAATPLVRIGRSAYRSWPSG
jgi:hypothetical protein